MDMLFKTLSVYYLAKILSSKENRNVKNYLKLGGSFSLALMFV